MSRDEDQGGDGFLGRWSRRKRTVARDAPDVPAPKDTAEDTAAGNAPPEPPREADGPPESDAEILARLELPDPDTLGMGDDFARYLNAPLPMHLKRRALRRLWVSNPVLANLDGLNDYDTDFTGNTVPLGTLKTAYKVGRGFLAKEADSEAPPPPAADADESAAAAEEESPATECAEEETAELSPDEIPSEVPEDAESPEDEHDYADLRTKRRMRFRFDD